MGSSGVGYHLNLLSPGRLGRPLSDQLLSAPVSLQAPHHLQKDSLLLAGEFENPEAAYRLLVKNEDARQ